jgi:hypothetical protein
MSVPSLPWCQEKNMQRALGLGLLPEAVRRRPKTPLVGESFRIGDVPWWADGFEPAPEFEQYVTLAGLPLEAPKSYEEIWASLRLPSFNCWLRMGRRSGILNDKDI